MKKGILIFFIIQICLVSLVSSVVQAEETAGVKKMFMVSAYYSPLPDQNFYIRGSYEADKKLNGNGTNGADGTQVYIGMLAAPKSYPFGTKIKLPGLGVGEVHDRGGAIIAGKNYDRIDVWMGKGEEGLARALNWGMRLVEGEMYTANSGVSPALNFEWVADKLPSATEKNLIAKTVAVATISSNQVEANNVVATKQTDNIKKEIVASIDVSQIINSVKQEGYFYGENGLYTKTDNKNIKLFKLSILNKEQKRIRENIKLLVAGLGKNSSGNAVYALQQVLWELGYYKSQLNGTYDDVTMDAVFNFQKDNQVIKSESDAGAGYFGVKTHTALVAAMSIRSVKVADYPQEMHSWVPAKTVLPKINDFEQKIEIVKREPLKFGI